MVFPLGGVLTFDLEGGIVPPGGVSYDINCGCRLIATKLTLDTDVGGPKRRPVNYCFVSANTIGVGSTGAVKLSGKIKKFLEDGAKWNRKSGRIWNGRPGTTEDGGAMEGADPEQVPARAIGARKAAVTHVRFGQSFLEIEVVQEIFDETAARIFGLRKGQINIMIHSGSRGLGYQICDDYLALMVGDLAENRN